MKWLGRVVPYYGGLRVREDDCSYIWNIPAKDRCEWLRATPDCNVESLVPYPTLLFCSFGSEDLRLFSLGLGLLIVWLLYLFLILGTTSDNFFCPSLSVIASVLRLSENIAGVTILAFGNGSPDIFTSLVSSEEERLIIFTELIGAGVFVTAVIAGSVAVCSPFRIQPKYFIRDACFYILTTCWICYIVSDETVHFWEALCCIGIYILFIIVVVSMQKLDNSQDQRKKRMPTLQDPEVLRIFVENRGSDSETQLPRPLRSRAFDVQAKLDVAIVREVGRNGASKADPQTTSAPSTSRPRGLFSEFFYDTSPINLDEWRSSRVSIKVLLVLRAPFMFLLQLCVPVVNETAEKRGWSKLLNCMQIWLTPVLAFYVLQLLETYLLLVCFCCTTAISLLVLCTTVGDKIPKYHDVLAFMGFLSAMLVVYVVAQEVMAVLECVGYASGISDAMLGITLLSWGNSVGDLISNVTIARKGYPRMGFSACFGGPMFNTLLGLGLTFGISTTTNSAHKIRIRTSDLAPGCLTFLLASLVSSILYLCATGFLARRSYGYLLYSIYATFMTINVLSELHYIHPLGTDHRPDDVL